MIEHHPTVMTHADWIVDLGPGAGCLRVALDRRGGGPERLGSEGGSPQSSAPVQCAEAGGSCAGLRSQPAPI